MEIKRWSTSCHISFPIHVLIDFSNEKLFFFFSRSSTFVYLSNWFIDVFFPINIISGSKWKNMVGEKKRATTIEEKKKLVDRSDSINNNASTSPKRKWRKKRTFYSNMSLQGIDLNSLSFSLQLIFSISYSYAFKIINIIQIQEKSSHGRSMVRIMKNEVRVCVCIRYPVVYRPLERFPYFFF